MHDSRSFISVWTLTRRADDSRSLYLHAGHVQDDGGVEWEKPYWHPVTEEAATHFASKHPPRRRDVRRWGRPDETLVAVWEGEDWEEEDLDDEDEDDECTEQGRAEGDQGWSVVDATIIRNADDKEE